MDSRHRRDMKIKIEEADTSDQDKLASIFDAPLPGVSANLEKDEEEPQEVIIFIIKNMNIFRRHIEVSGV